MNLNREQLADLFGVTPRTISAWANEPGFPRPTKKGRENAYDARQCVKWWKDREVARLIEAEDGSLLNLDQERAALARAQRLRVEQDMRERRGELAERAPLERAFRQTSMTVRDSILAVPHRLSAVVAAETDSDRCHDLMTTELRSALEALAGGAKKLAAKNVAQAEQEQEADQ